jgi:hypothetical protein
MKGRAGFFTLTVLVGEVELMSGFLCCCGCVGRIRAILKKSPFCNHPGQPVIEGLKENADNKIFRSVPALGLPPRPDLRK